MAIQQIYTIDKFLGLNEAADSASELRHGEASRMVNFTVTDSGNISARPGFSEATFLADTQRIVTMWSGYLQEDAYLVIVDFVSDTDRITVVRVEGTQFIVETQSTGLLGLNIKAENTVKIFPFGDRIYVMSANKDLSIRAATGISIQEETPYIPLVVTGASAQGGGTQLENINLLTSRRRITYSADGTSTKYTLPGEATAIISAETDSGALSVTFSQADHSAVFTTAPEKGVTNLTVTYDTDNSAAGAARKQVTDMPFWEAYNGAADTRLFFYGDGSNVTLYSGVTDTGKASPLYVPAMNEIAVDFSASPITGMIRLYNKLMICKPDGASFITYEPVTLTDGSVIAGFYLRTASKTFGCDAPGQIQLVNNYPRTFHGGALYDWRTSSSSYNDERYAKRISDRVASTLSSATPERLVSCDNDSDHTWYLFLGDTKGTILVNRYNLDVWTVYRSSMATDVKHATVCHGTLIFATNSKIFYLDPAARCESEAIWESGFMGYGQNYRRKFSTYLWFSIKPESFSNIIITASSDRKSKYAEKQIISELFDYGNINYANWSYIISSFIRSRRIKLKVKKVTFYQLVIRVPAGSRGTVLGIDQQLRFGSLVK